jgi:hypothetical protein
LATQEDVDTYNERYNKSIEFIRKPKGFANW